MDRPFPSPVFERTQKRLIAGVPNGDPAVFTALVECLEPPLILLYVLHTPRSDAPAGRYQSPELSLAEVKAFLRRFADYLAGDSRFDLWAHSISDNATIVWDRHNRLFGYGPLERLSFQLTALGFGPGIPKVPVPHQHHYHPEFDSQAADLLSAFDWSHSPLRPEDEQ